MIVLICFAIETTVVFWLLVDDEEFSNHLQLVTHKLLEKAAGEIKPDAVFNHFNLKFKQVYMGQISTAKR